MGPLLCLLSAACFGAMAIFGKLAYDAGVGVGDLLLVRFAIAAVLLLVVAGTTGALRGVPRRSLVAGLAMGGIGYATQSGLFFGALGRIDASLLALILYAYPALVTVGAILLGRERASRRRIAALVLASVGTALVLGGAATGTLDPLGAAMGFGAAVAYMVYILVGDRVGAAGGDRPTGVAPGAADGGLPAGADGGLPAGAGIPPVALSSLVCTGAACTFALASVVRGGPQFGFAPSGWLWLVAIAVISTVAAILAFFAGMARVGPSAASILSTLEPVVTVLLAATIFAENLTVPQVLGGVVVLGAVLVVQWPARKRALVPAT
ncbi:DMT family transporter [Kribbella sp. NPDC051770]|uniref:DMT family transporter n=1 Tax=Kribbella sp. NPDC051770 TaxID=3155413 RepID=UPI0034205059